MNLDPRIAMAFILAATCAAPSSAAPPKRKPAPAAAPRQAKDAQGLADSLRRSEERLACLTEQGRLQVELERRRGACEAKATEIRSCIARVRDRQSSNTGKGALLGLGAAVLTGGASLLFTGAGAVIGHQTSDEAPNECGNPPACDPASVAEATARETGLRWRACPAEPTR